MTEKYEPFDSQDPVNDSPINTKRVIRVNDKDRLVESATWKKDGDEDYLEKKEVTDKSADGYRVRPDQIIGTSWTGKDIPQGKNIECADPYELHEFEKRLCFNGVDGKPLDLGTPVCAFCFYYHNEIIKLSDTPKCLWGLLFGPKKL